MPPSRETLLVQLLAIGNSVDKLRTELVELGGALIEAERRRLRTQLRSIEQKHAELLDAVAPQAEH